MEHPPPVDHVFRTGAVRRFPLRFPRLLHCTVQQTEETHETAGHPHDDGGGCLGVDDDEVIPMVRVAGAEYTTFWIDPSITLYDGSSLLCIPLTIS